MNLATLVNEHPSSARALFDRGRWYTWGEVRGASAAVAQNLSKRGVSAGDRVAIAWPNSADFVFAYLGVLSAGAVAVPLNPNSPASELLAELSTVGATVLLAGGQAAQQAHELQSSEEELRGMAVGSSIDQLPVTERTDDEVACLMFTSGTAGAPRAAKLTHCNLVSNLKQMLGVPDTLRREDIALASVPLFHIFGLNVALGLVLATGAAVVLEERFDAQRSLDLVATLGVTVIVGVPPMFAAWADAAERAAAEDAQKQRSLFASVRHAVSGAATLPDEVAQLFERRFEIPVWQGYGLTEASPGVATSLGTGRNQPGSVGRPLPGVQVRLVEETGGEALEGDPGEIWVRGPNVFAGYWNDDPATSQVLTPDGWLRTGDIGVVGEHGDLFVVDRKKDLVIVSGFNVFPGEVERTILEIPGVAEAAVVGKPDTATGEAVEAVVVAGTGGRSHDGRSEGALRQQACPLQVPDRDPVRRGPPDRPRGQGPAPHGAPGGFVGGAPDRASPRFHAQRH